MAGSREIKAGEAYIDLGVRVAHLQKGLDAAAQKLKAFGASVRGIGFGAIAGGAAVLAPLGLALKKFTELGPKLADPEARAEADRLGKNFTVLLGIVDKLAVTIGEALAPVVSSIIEWLSKASTQVLAFIKDNAWLVQAVAAVGVGLVVGGGALVAFGGILSGVAAVLSGISFALGAVVPIVTALGGAVAFLISPWGLALAAIAGGGVALLHFSGVGGRAVAFLKEKFAALLEQAKWVFGGIVAALKTGDFKGAANILWLSLRLAWLEGVRKLRTIWEGFKNYFLDAFDAAWTAFKTQPLVKKFLAAVDVMRATFSKFKDWLVSAFEGAAAGIAAAFQGVLTWAQRTLSGVGSVLKATTGDSGVLEIANALAAIAKNPLMFAAGVDDKTRKGLQERSAKRRAESEALLSQQAEESAAAFTELAVAVETAKAKAQAQAAATVAAASNADAAAAPTALQAAGARVQGTFSAAAASRFGAVTSSVDKKLVSNTERTAKGIETLINIWKPGDGLQFT